MSAHDPKTKLLGLGVFLLPLLLVKGTGMMLGQPPQGAVAATTNPTTFDGSGIETFTPEWSSAQIAAAQRVAELRELPFGESPLLHIREMSEIAPTDTVDPTPKVIAPPEVSVKMILRSRRGNVALIDRKRYRDGDAIGEDGWIVKKISTRSVVVVHPESGDRKHVRVIVMTREPGRFRDLAHRRAHRGMTVGGDANAYPGTADYDRPLRSPVGNGLRRSVPVVRVVDCGIAICS